MSTKSARAKPKWPIGAHEAKGGTGARTLTKLGEGVEGGVLSLNEQPKVAARSMRARGARVAN